MLIRICLQCRKEFSARTNGVTCSKACARRRHTNQSNEARRERYAIDDEFRKKLCGRSTRYRDNKALTDVEYPEKERTRNAGRMREKRRSDPAFRAIDTARTADYLRKRRLDVEFQERDNARRAAHYRNHRDESAAELLGMLRRGELVPVGYPCFTYMFYDDHHALLYVGITNDPKRRLYQHARNKPWFEEINRVNLAAFRSETEAMAAEACLIKSMQPLHNIRHNGICSKDTDGVALNELLLRFASVDLLSDIAVTQRLVIA